MKLSIKDFAAMQSITSQAVYQAIAKGKLKSVTEDGKKWVVVDSEAIKPVTKDTNQDVNQELVNDLFKQLKSKDKQIKSLTKQLLKCSQSKEDVLLSYIQELKQMKQLTSAPVHEDEDVIDVPTKKKKKKKGKKKKHKSIKWMLDDIIHKAILPKSNLSLCMP